MLLCCNVTDGHQWLAPLDIAEIMYFHGEQVMLAPKGPVDHKLALTRGRVRDLYPHHPREMDSYNSILKERLTNSSLDSP